MKQKESIGEQEMDPSNVSAFAVYKNMIPGLTTYEDTNSASTARSRKRKMRNRKRKALETAALVKHEPTSSPSPEPKKNKKKNKNKQNTLGHEPEVQVVETVEFEEVVVAQKPKKKKKKGVVPVLSEEASPDTRNTIAIFRPNAKSNSPLNEDRNTAKQNGFTKQKSKESASDSFNNFGKTTLDIHSILFSSEPVDNSVLHGKSIFEWLIHPTPVEQFFSENWEKKPLHVKRITQRDYYSWLMSSSTLDDVMKKNMIKFGKNIDLTSYVDGVRETHNPEGRALPAVVWDYYSNGCSVRFLNPQTYIKPLWRLNASLQEFFGTFVGANVYLTPPDSQGFAPHYDDIEAFVIQIEGYKRWKLYKPRSKEEELPRLSSQNFNEKTDGIGKPIMDVIMSPGDILYFPRGTIHQAKAVEGEHSLHITISAYQANTYADFLKIYLPLALEQSIHESLDLRRGLPTDFLSYMGIVHSDKKGKKIKAKREAFTKKIKTLVDGILTKSCDFAADQLGKKLVWDSLPPYLTGKEKRRSVFGDSEFINEGQVLNRTEIGPDTEVKLIRKHACRLVIEENSLRLFFSIENSLEYHEDEAQYLELPNEAGPAIEYLTSKYPEFTRIEDFPLEDETLKVQLAADMWEKGLLMTKNPQNPFVFDGDVEELDTEEEISSENFSTDQEESNEEEEEDEDRAFINDAFSVSDYSDDDEVPPRLVERKAITCTSTSTAEEEEESDEDVPHPMNRNSGRAIIEDDSTSSEEEAPPKQPTKRRRVSSGFIL